MALQLSTGVQALMELREQANRAVRLYLNDQYPIDSDEKLQALRLLAREAATAEHNLRCFMHRRR